jgi:PPOX class probable F420-dependent enzyme
VATDLGTFAALASRDSLCVVTATRSDGSVQASLVNAGVLDGRVAYVARGDALKVRLLRERPACSVTVRDGFEWVTVEGSASIVGPDDVRDLLREIFQAAGGTHEDWDEFDRVMAEERRLAVFVTPTRVYGITR